jgi:predicted transcriptional regulator
MLTPHQRSTAHRLRSGGMSFEAIGKVLGCSPTTVAKLFSSPQPKKPVGTKSILDRHTAITSTVIGKNHKRNRPRRDLSKDELRDMLADAVRNTKC